LLIVGVGDSLELCFVNWREHGLTIASDLLPDLNHVELIAARQSLDALGSRCDELMALLEFETESDARARAADEVPA
jgi:hypothetical protein